MKTQIIRTAGASLIAITLLVGSLCNTLAAGRSTGKVTPVSALTNSTPATATAPGAGVVTQVITNSASKAIAKGMNGGVTCLFINKASADITLSATATNTLKGTFTLELKAKSNRTFNVLPGEYDYTWTVGEDSKSYPVDSNGDLAPATLTVDRKPVHLYDGTGEYHAVVIFKGK